MEATIFLGAVVVTNVAYAVELRKRGIGARPLQLGGSALEDPSAAQLLLLDEEAFYLASHSSLVVTSDGQTITTEQLWSTFYDKDTSFPNKYIVYMHFRDKGYVVKTGVNFGVDYCIYDRLPSECHSEMCVTVVDGWGGGATGTSGRRDLSEGVLSWRHITTLTRAMPDVMKLCVVCFVLPVGAIRPPLMPDTAASAMLVDQPDCAMQGGNGSNSGDNASDSGPSGSSGAVSPYLSLFPDYRGAQRSTTVSAASNVPPVIDPSTPACLRQLRVHSVTALVRRQAAVASTYQTIAQIQAQYRSASTAQKRAGGKGNGGQNKPRKYGNKSKSGMGTASEGGKVDGLGKGPEEDSMDLADDAADGSSGKPLSARQQRIAKYLRKTGAAGLQQGDGSRRNLGSLEKERRDHHENRTKTMSNKNQSLLDALTASGSQTVAAGQSVGSSSGSIGVGVGAHGNAVTLEQRDGCDASAAGVVLGQKRPLAPELPAVDSDPSGRAGGDGCIDGGEDRKRQRGETDEATRGWGGWLPGFGSSGEGSQGRTDWVSSCTIS